MRISNIIVALTVLLSFAPGASRGHATEITYLAPPGEPARAFPKPERSVAKIVSPVRSTERQRDAFDESGQLARLLAITPGMSVGDIGAGSGYHTVRLSPLVGRAGRVIAQDVTPDYLKQLAGRIKRLKLSNVRLALGEPHDPRLPAASLDVAILVHMYHEVAQPYAFLYNLAPALKSGARVGIVDLDRPTSQHGTPLEVLRCEVEAIGYRQIALHRLVGDPSYLAVFSPPSEAARKPPRDIVACKPADR